MVNTSDVDSPIFVAVAVCGRTQDYYNLTLNSVLRAVWRWHGSVLSSIVPTVCSCHTAKRVFAWARTYRNYAGPLFNMACIVGHFLSAALSHGIDYRAAYIRSVAELLLYGCSREVIQSSVDSSVACFCMMCMLNTDPSSNVVNLDERNIPHTGCV